MHLPLVHFFLGVGKNFPCTYPALLCTVEQNALCPTTVIFFTSSINHSSKWRTLHTLLASMFLADAIIYTHYSCGRNGIKHVKEPSYLNGVIPFYLPLSDILVPVLFNMEEKKNLLAACSFGGGFESLRLRIRSKLPEL